MRRFFQWLIDSPRLYFRTPLHVNECVKAIEAGIENAGRFAGSLFGQSAIEGKVTRLTFVLCKGPSSLFTPVFHGKMIRLDTGTMISGYFALGKPARAVLAFLATGPPCAFLSLPFAWSATRIRLVIACSVVAVVWVIVFARMRFVTEDTIDFFVKFLGDTLQAQLTRRVE